MWPYSKTLACLNHRMPLIACDTLALYKFLLIEWLIVCHRERVASTSATVFCLLLLQYILSRHLQSVLGLNAVAHPVNAINSIHFYLFHFIQFMFLVQKSKRYLQAFNWHFSRQLNDTLKSRNHNGSSTLASKSKMTKRSTATFCRLLRQCGRDLRQ